MQEKDNKDSDENASRSAEQRRHMDGGNTPKVEAAKRRGQNGNEGRSKAIEVHKCTRRSGCLLGVLLAFRRLDPRNEALLEVAVKQATVTRHPWLIACDANMCPEDLERSL